MVNYFIFIILILCGPSQVNGQDKSLFAVLASFRVLSSSNYSSIGGEYSFGGRNAIEFGVNYLHTDELKWENNEILTRTFFPQNAWDRLGWHLAYRYRILTLNNGCRIDVGFDVNKVASHTKAIAVIPGTVISPNGTFTYLTEVQKEAYFSLLETAILIRTEFKIVQNFSFLISAGISSVFTTDYSRTNSLLNWFDPGFRGRPYLQGLGYHSSLGIMYKFNQNK